MKLYMLLFMLMLAVLVGCSDHRTTLHLEDTPFDTQALDNEILLLCSLAGYDPAPQIVHAAEGEWIIQPARRPSREQRELLQFYLKRILAANSDSDFPDFRLEITETDPEILKEIHVTKEEGPQTYPLRFDSGRGQLSFGNINLGTEKFTQCVYVIPLVELVPMLRYKKIIAANNSEELKKHSGLKKLMELHNISAPFHYVKHRITVNDPELESITSSMEINSDSMWFVFFRHPSPGSAEYQQRLHKGGSQVVLNYNHDYSSCQEKVKVASSAFYRGLYFPHLTHVLRSFE